MCVCIITDTPRKTYKLLRIPLYTKNHKALSDTAPIPGAHAWARLQHTDGPLPVLITGSLALHFPAGGVLRIYATVC